MIRRLTLMLALPLLSLLGLERPASAQGFAVYASSGKVYTVQIGQPAKQLYDGSAAHAVWSAKALYIYFIKTNGQIWRMNNDGSDAHEIASGINSSYNPIAAYRPDPESVLYVNGTDFYRINAPDGKMTKIHSGSRWYVGEVAVNEAGTRLVARDDNSDLFKITVGGSATLYDTDCSASISPDGNRMTSNVSGHMELTIHDWSGGTHKTLNSPGKEWDNQKFAVNSNDYVVYRFDDGSGIGVNQVSQDSNTAIAGPNSLYPDFYVGSSLPSVGSTPPSEPPPSEPPPSEPPPSEPPVGETIVIEAESMTLSGYEVEDGSLIATMGTGTATASFPGVSGRYRLAIAIVKENDGEPTLDVTIGGTLVKQIQYELGSSSRDPDTLDLGELDVEAGAMIELTGVREGDAAARVDRLTFTLVVTAPDPDDPPPAGGAGAGPEPPPTDGVGAAPAGGANPGATNPLPGEPGAASSLEGSAGCSATGPAAGGGCLPTVALVLMLLALIRRRS